MSRFTAIVLSKNPVELVLPGVDVLGRVQTISNLAELLDARLESLKHAKTEFCFMLDDDDSLPLDYLEVLEECAARGEAVAYTDELIDAGNGWVRARVGGYSQEQHHERPFLLHHLVLMRTKDALECAEHLPRGNYAFEPLLYFPLAKRGVAYVERVGYLWKQGRGLSTHPDSTDACMAAQMFNRFGETTSWPR